MKKEEIIPGDWKRILLGEAPPIFLVEVLLRTLIIYVVLLIIVRLMGKRMGGQLTISELAVMITLGAIVSPGMQTPQTGVLLDIMILICALTFQRGLNLAEYKSKKFERVSQGVMSIILKDGVMDLKVMANAKISRQQLFSAIRSKDVFNLGDLDRVYLEPCGLFTIYRKDQPVPGLVIFPPDDKSIDCFSQQITKDKSVCLHCGTTVPEEKANEPCPTCGSEQWEQASVTLSETSTQEASKS